MSKKLLQLSPQVLSRKPERCASSLTIALTSPLPRNLRTIVSGGPWKAALSLKTGRFRPAVRVTLHEDLGTLGTSGLLANCTGTLSSEAMQRGARRLLFQRERRGRTPQIDRCSICELDLHKFGCEKQKYKQRNTVQRRICECKKCFGRNDGKSKLRALISQQTMGQSDHRARNT